LKSNNIKDLMSICRRDRIDTLHVSIEYGREQRPIYGIQPETVAQDTFYGSTAAIPTVIGSREVYVARAFVRSLDKEVTVSSLEGEPSDSEKIYKSVIERAHESMVLLWNNGFKVTVDKELD